MYLASDKQLYLFHLDSEDFKGQQISGDSLTVRVINPELPIHGFVMNDLEDEDDMIIVMMETHDN